MRTRNVLTVSVLVGLLALGSLAYAKAKVDGEVTPAVSREDVMARGGNALAKAESLLTQADRMIARGEIDPAIDLLNRVVGMQLPAERESDKIVAGAYGTLGTIYDDPARDPMKAAVFYGSAVERMSIEDDLGLIADTLGRISTIYLAQGNTAASAQIEGMLIDISQGNPPAEFNLVPTNPGVTTRDAGDDTCDASQMITLPWAEQMSINPAFDQNWRSFTLTEPRILTIETLDADTLKDTKLDLYSGCSGGTPTGLIDTDDDGGPGLLSLIETDCLAPGEYFVKVYAFSDRTPQDFTFAVTDAPCPIPPEIDEYEPDNEPAGANRIGFRNNGNGQGNQGGRDNSQIQRHSFFPAPDIDYVYFGLSRANYVNIETFEVDGNGADTVIGVTNSGGVLYAVNDDKAPGDFGSKLRFCLPSGDYYVPMLPFDGGDEFYYDVLVDVEGACLFESEPNGTCSQANEIGTGEVWNGIHAPQGLTFEEDWFSFDIAETALVTIETDGYDDFDVDTYLELYDACGGNLLASDSDGGPGFLSQIQMVLEPGTYYILNRLDPLAFTTGTTYPYSLTVTLSEAPLVEMEPNDACGDGNAAFLGDSILASIDPVGDRDSFLLSVPSDGLVEIETAGGSGDTVLNIASTDGSEQIGCDDDGGDGLFSKWSCCLPAGDYCVTVKDYLDNGTISAYTIDFRNLGTCNPGEPLVCDVSSSSQCDPF